jgi:hypothetical protein
VRVELDSEVYYTEDMISAIAVDAVSGTDANGSGHLPTRVPAAMVSDSTTENSECKVPGVKKTPSKAPTASRKKNKGRVNSLSLDGKTVCRACAFAAHSAHTCGNRGKAANPATILKQEMQGSDDTLIDPATATTTADRTTRAAVSLAAESSAVEDASTSVLPIASPTAVEMESSPTPTSHELTSAMLEAPRRKRTASVDSDVRSDESSPDCSLFFDHPHQMRTPEKDDHSTAPFSVFSATPSPSVALARRPAPPLPRFRRRTEPADLLGLSALSASDVWVSNFPLTKRARFDSMSSNDSSMSLTAMRSSPPPMCAHCDGMLIDERLSTEVNDHCVTCAALEDCAIKLTLKQCTLYG